MTQPALEKPARKTYPSIEHALDIRSYEQVTVIADPESTYSYPEHWKRPASINEVSLNGESAVIVDRMDLSRSSFVNILLLRPRIFAVVVDDLDHEKSVRRTLKALYPWSQLWETFTDFGKTLYMTGGGDPYDRELIVDQRTEAQA